MLTIDGKKYLVEKELASKYGLSIHFFRRARYVKRNLSYFKLGGKVYFEESEINEWIKNNLKQCT